MYEYNKCEMCGEPCLIRFCSEKCYIEYKNKFLPKEEPAKKQRKPPRKKLPFNPSHKNNCVICKRKCLRKYCCVECKRKGWKKSEYYKKNKCDICGKKCIGNNLCRKCYFKYITNREPNCCLHCDKVLHEYIPIKGERREYFCSDECKKLHTAHYHDFFEGDNVEEIYYVLGVLFYYGFIYDYGKHEIHICAYQKKEINFILDTIQLSDMNKVDEKLIPVIVSEKWVNYLFDIGFSDAVAKHTFPTINYEFIKFFINGYINKKNTKIVKFDDYNLITIKSESYELMRGITDYTSGVFSYYKTLFVCEFKDYDKYYQI